MKKKTENKVEMKEKVLSENALALDDAELEGAAGGFSMEEMQKWQQMSAEEINAMMEEQRRRQQEMMEQVEEMQKNRPDILDALQNRGPITMPGDVPEYEQMEITPELQGVFDRMGLSH